MPVFNLYFLQKNPKAGLISAADHLRWIQFAEKKCLYYE